MALSLVEILVVCLAMQVCSMHISAIITYYFQGADVTYLQNPPNSDTENLLVLIKAIVSCCSNNNKLCIESNVQKEVTRLSSSGVDHASARSLTKMAVDAGLAVKL